jgi:hypothetical protein
MPDKRLIYFTSSEVRAYKWARGNLECERSFVTGDDALEEFTKYVAGASGSLFYLLADVVEEDFAQENIPYVRGKDRRALLFRKLAQRYRDTSLALALSVGVEDTGRREERILYSSFTNTQQFQPWLAALSSQQARLAGVYSVPLVTPAATKRIKFKANRYLFVSVQRAGLRQSFVDNGSIRFSRLGKIDMGDPRAVAEAAAVESERIQQYLVNTRVLPREAPALDVVILAPSVYKPLYEAACREHPKLRFHILDLHAASKQAGLKSAPTEDLAESLFLHVLASTRIADQFADDDLRRYYDLWRAKVGIVAGGAAVLGLCLLTSGWKMLGVREMNSLADADRQQEALAAQQYNRTQATFPKTPLPTENLTAIVKNYQALLRQDAPLSAILADVSQAMAVAPQIELEKIEWEAGAGKQSGPAEARKGPESASRVPSESPETKFQRAEISGRLLVPQASDYRNISTLVDQFVQALRARPGIDVLEVKLPFDITAEKSISGDIGTERAAEIPRFSVTVTKRFSP